MNQLKNMISKVKLTPLTIGVTIAVAVVISLVIVVLSQIINRENLDDLATKIPEVTKAAQDLATKSSDLTVLAVSPVVKAADLVTKAQDLATENPIALPLVTKASELQQKAVDIITPSFEAAAAVNQKANDILNETVTSTTMAPVTTMAPTTTTTPETTTMVPATSTPSDVTPAPADVGLASVDALEGVSDNKVRRMLSNILWDQPQATQKKLVGNVKDVGTSDFLEGASM